MLWPNSALKSWRDEAEEDVRVGTRLNVAALYQLDHGAYLFLV